MRISTQAGADRYLVGRTIDLVEMRPFRTGRPEHPVAHDPVLVLDDGSRVRFVTVETDVGEYGLDVVHERPIPDLRGEGGGV